MPRDSWAAPTRRALLPVDEDFDDASRIDRPRTVLPTIVVTPEVHAANGRFADAILGTTNYEDAARTAVFGLKSRGEAALPEFYDLMDQIHERSPEVATSFAGSVRRAAEDGSAAAVETDEPATPPSDVRRTVGAILFPGQVKSDRLATWQNVFFDLAPGLGNWRSVSQAAEDVEEAIAAYKRGEYTALLGHSLMAIVGAVGAVPAAGNLIAPAKPFIRNVVRATPGGKRVHASRLLAKAKARFDDLGPSTSLEKLYGDLWNKLPKQQQKRLATLRSDVIGKAGEDYADELLPSAGFSHSGDGQVAWTNSRGVEKIREYDAETAEGFRTIFFDLFAVPTAGHTWFEVKTAAAKLKPPQIEADAVIGQTKAIEYLRLRLDEVPFEFLAAQTKRLLEEGAKDGKTPFSDREIADLITSMRKARRPDMTPLTAFDWLGMVARLSAEADSEED